MTRSLVAPVFLRRFFFPYLLVLSSFASLALVFFLVLRRGPLSLHLCRSSRPAPLSAAILLPLLGPCVELPVSLWPGFSFGLDGCFFFQIALMALTTF